MAAKWVTVEAGPPKPLDWLVVATAGHLLLVLVAVGIMAVRQIAELPNPEVWTWQLPSFWQFVVILGLNLILAQAWIRLFSKFWMHHKGTQESAKFFRGSFLRAVALSIGFGAGEEIAFRWLLPTLWAVTLFGGLPLGAGFVAGLLLANISFGILHGDRGFPMMVKSFTMGVMCAILLMAYGLPAAILLHVGYDIALSVVSAVKRYVRK